MYEHMSIEKNDTHNRSCCKLIQCLLKKLVCLDYETIVMQIKFYTKKNNTFLNITVQQLNNFVFILFFLFYSSSSLESNENMSHWLEALFTKIKVDIKWVNKDCTKLYWKQSRQTWVHLLDQLKKQDLKESKL